MNHPIIRPAFASDAAELARLTTQLGYPATEAAIRSRLVRILASANDCLLVADVSSGELSGWIHGFLSQCLEADYRAEIGGLVVAERWRRHGIGRQLVNAIDVWAIKQGVAELSVHCREERAASHKFYEGLMFRHTKTQRVFRKPTGTAA